MATSLSSNIANQLKSNFSSSLSNIGKNIVQNMANNAKQNFEKSVQEAIANGFVNIVKNAKTTSGTSTPQPTTPNSSGSQGNATSASGEENVVPTTASDSSINTPTYKTSQDYIDDLNYVNAAADRRQSALDRLTEANYQTLREQQNQVKPTYDAARNSAYTASRISALGNNEYLANQGLAGNAYQSAMTGYSESARIQNDIALQNNLNYLNEQERSTVQALANAIRTAQNEYNLNRESIEQDREDMIYELNSSYRDAEKAAENTRLTNLENMWENGYELNAEEAQALIDGYGTTANYLYKDNPTGYVDYIESTNNWNNANADLLIKGLISKGDDYIESESVKQALEDAGLYNKVRQTLEKTSSYRVGEALKETNISANLREILTSLKDYADVIQGDASTIASAVINSLHTLDDSDYDKLYEVFGITENAYKLAQQKIFNDVITAVKDGTATSDQKVIAQLYALDTRTDEEKEGMHYVQYTKDGKTEERAFVKAEGAKIHGGNDLLNLTNGSNLGKKNKDVDIKVNGTTYEVEFSGDSTNVEGTSTGAENYDLTVSGGKLYICVSGKWYNLRSQSNKKDEFANLLNYVKGKGAVDPDNN